MLLLASVAVLLLTVAVAVAHAAGPLVRRWAATSLLASFDRDRRRLEHDALSAAASSGKPKGLVWKSLTFDREVLLARCRPPADWLAAVGVAIDFEAVEGGPMEGVAMVAQTRRGTAMFVVERLNGRSRWRPSGRIVFNHDPEDALRVVDARCRIVGRSGPATAREPPAPNRRGFDN